MKIQLLNLLCCTHCRADLRLTEASEANGEIEKGRLVCMGCDRSYLITNFIPRFGPEQDYAIGFGFQWNRFRQTQLDSHTGVPISHNRFVRQTGWSRELMVGKMALDVGCGAGRFAEIALSFGAHVVAVDCSTAVDGCLANLYPHPNLNIVQADIYALPFRIASYDFVYCFGVLQHTPDVKRAFMALPRILAEGGRLAVDVYPRLLENIVWPKYWLRFFTKHMSPDTLFLFVEVFVGILWPFTLAVGRIPFIGRKLRYAIPVANYEGVYPLSRAQLYEWAVLDTFDMLAPFYDQPQSASAMTTWFRLAGLREIEVFRDGLIVGRGTV